MRKVLGVTGVFLITCGLAILTLWPWVGFLPSDTWKALAGMVWGWMWAVPMVFAEIHILGDW